MEEKAIQVLSPPEGGSSQEPVLAAVGELQFEVVQYRLKAEYGVETSLERLPYSAARWVGAGWDALAAGEPLFQTPTYKDDAGRPVLLFRNPWHLEATVKERPDLQLTAVAISEARAGNGASA
jgi:peptide chain release factor 3